MKIIAWILIIVGILGFVMGGAMFGDIGFAAWIGSAAALLSGIGFLIAAKKIAK